MARVKITIDLESPAENACSYASVCKKQCEAKKRNFNEEKK